MAKNLGLSQGNLYVQREPKRCFCCRRGPKFVGLGDLLVMDGSTGGLMKGVLQGGVGGGEGHSFASLSPLMPRKCIANRSKAMIHGVTCGPSASVSVGRFNFSSCTC